MVDEVQVPPEGIELFRAAFGSCRLTALLLEGDVEKVDAEIADIQRYYDLGGAGRAAVRAWEHFCRALPEPVSAN